ncbi:hypothetical protein Tco_0071413 [Tanacetum coccineum]
MINEFNKCISERSNPLPITKNSYIVNSSNVATMKITRDNDPLNLTSLKAKFQWVLNQAKKLGLPPPPALATFGMTDEKRKKKMTKFIKEVFVTEDVRVDGIERNPIPHPGVALIQGLVINEPEPWIFFMNWNTDIGFQRENEFHLAPTTDLIRIYNKIKTDSEIASEMFTKMIYVIEARNDCNKAREIVEKNLDNVTKEPLSDGTQRLCKDSLSAKHQRATSDKEYAEVLRRVRGGNTLTILLPFEEEQTELKDCSLKKECPSNKTSTPSYPSSNNSFNKPKPYTPPFNQTSSQNTSNHQKDYKGKYKGLKAEMAILTKRIDDLTNGKESVSSEDEGTTRIRAFMAIAEDEPSVGKTDARSCQ